MLFQRRFLAATVGSIALLAAFGIACTLEFQHQRTLAARAEVHAESVADQRGEALESFARHHLALFGKVLGAEPAGRSPLHLDAIRAALKTVATRPEAVAYIAEADAVISASADSLVSPQRLLAIEEHSAAVRRAMRDQASLERIAAHNAVAGRIAASEWRVTIFGASGLALALILCLYAFAFSRSLPSFRTASNAS